jgi:hypothetical protein
VFGGGGEFLACVLSRSCVTPPIGNFAGMHASHNCRLRATYVHSLEPKIHVFTWASDEIETHVSKHGAMTLE